MPKKRPYDQFCPIATALDLVGDRWTLLIIRELFLGPVRYGELLAELDSVSTDVLAKRLRELEAAGIVQHGDDRRYDLTASGRGLAPVLQALGGWGVNHLRTPEDPADLSAARAVQLIAVIGAGQPSPEERTVLLRTDDLEATLSSGPDGLCARREPATDPDATVTTDGATLWRVGSGQQAWSDALDVGAITVEGDPDAARAILASSMPPVLDR